MATTYEHSTVSSAPNASTKILVYWIVGIIATILIIAYVMGASGPINDPSLIIAPSPVRTFPVPQ
ncbi:MAG: hypothetical protein H7235_03075 [Bdellovibrionaceae bacterium]|nr:hypothetical protein [Pseudobdellovibrionaceae bacterium]